MSVRPLTIDCVGVHLQGMLHAPSRPASVGVVLIVGGPQYRVGSHRQFVHLCRALDAAGIAALRFDVRGMGDSAGEPRSFEHIAPDIAAAIDCLLREMSSVKRVVLWGLCDGATAAALYSPSDVRVAGLVLLNPWVRDSQLQAKTLLEGYYGRRLFDPSAWREILRSPVRALRAVGSVGTLLRRAVGSANRSDQSAAGRSLAERMARALERRPVPILLVLSGDDLTAEEFRAALQLRPWRRLMQHASVARVDLRRRRSHLFAGDLA